MKKINNIRQLAAKKKQVKQQQEALENNIRDNWKELKEGLKPATIAREHFNDILNNGYHERVNAKSILKTTLDYGANLLARQLVNKAGEKLGKLFKK